MRALLTLLLAGPSAAQPAVPRVDQAAYARELRAKRPDLWLRRADLCKDNLILKPVYRERVLSGKDDHESILAREYTAEKKELDRRWAERHRAWVAKIRREKPALPYEPKSFPEDLHVGYKVGAAKARPDGFVFYKVYLEFKDFEKDLSPEGYAGFMKALAEAGYQGGSKIQLRPGVARFKFNNVVLHANSMADARLAEKVGLAHFAGALASTGRGLDIDLDEEGGLDWSQYLCIGDLTRLPRAALDFAAHKD